MDSHKENTEKFVLNNLINISNNEYISNYISLLKEFLDNKNSTFSFACLISGFILILSILILIVRRSSLKGKSILLIGLSFSGKTAIYSRLVLEKIVESYISIKENSGKYVSVDLKGKSMDVVDIPGADSIRLRYFEQFKTQARGLVFVIDSSTFQKDLKDVAEFLLTIFWDDYLYRQRIPILIACNKQDIALAKGKSLIRSALQKEINQVRQTRSAALHGIEGKKKASNAYLSNKNKEFKFEDAYMHPVEFVEISARGGKEDKDGLEPLKKWIDKLTC